MTQQVHKEYPAVTGLIWHRDQHYSFFVPIDWHKMAWPDDRDGVVYGPDATDPLTVFAVDIKDLGTLVTADDLDVLAAGFFEGIEQLPEPEIEHRDQRVTGKVIELEAKYTFREQGQKRKRWVRVFYHGTRQIAMTAQGATPEEYDYWLPWFFEAMMTADIHTQKPRFAPGG